MTTIQDEWDRSGEIQPRMAVFPEAYSRVSSLVNLSLASNDGAVFFNFFRAVCDLNGSPGSNVPVLAGTKDAAQKSRYRAQCDVASMQRGHRTPFDLRLAHGKDPGRLTIC
jgi:hypothetical protein